MRTKTPATQPRARKTTDAVLSPEEWGPIVKWIGEHREWKDLRGMFIETAAARGVAVMLKKGRQLAHTQDMNLRLHHHRMEALAQQFRFWESCMDELSPKLQESAPPPDVFLEAALEVEAALTEGRLRERNERNERNKKFTQTPACTRCGQPVEGDGRATIDLDSQGRVTTLYVHIYCPGPTHQDC